MANYTQHVLILGHDAQSARVFIEELLDSTPQNDIRYTLIHPNAAQILLRLNGVDYVETSIGTQAFEDILKQGDGLMCLKPLETGILNKLRPLLETTGIKRAVFCTREGNYHPPAARAHQEIHYAIQDLIKSNLDWTLLRPTTICGGDDDPILRLSKKLQKRRSKFLMVNRTISKHFLQPLHERDFAQAFLKSFTNANTFRQIYGLSGHKPQKVEKIVNHMCHKLGIRWMRIPFGLRDARLPRWVLLATKDRPLRLTRLGQSIITPHEKAFRDFGFVPKVDLHLTESQTDD